MKEKKNETIPVGLFIGLLLLCTAVAGGIAFLAKGDMLKLPELNFNDRAAETIVVEQNDSQELPQEVFYVDEELHKVANTYGEIFGLLVTEGEDSLVEDKYCAEELYRVEYPSGEVQVNSVTKELYWFAKQGIKCERIQLTENQLVKKAKEYFNILQLDQEYGNIARKVDREKNIITVIFQTVVNEDLELYSDYEAVKMILSAQTGELMSCKIFDMPLVEQEGQMISQSTAIAAVQDELLLTFEEKAEAKLLVCSPLLWDDLGNYTSRIVWKVTADGMLYYVDAYNGDLLGSKQLDA